MQQKTDYAPIDLPLRTVVVARDGPAATTLEKLCSQSEPIRMVASAVSSERAMREADRHRADILLVSGASPDQSGIECINAWPLTYRERAIVVIDSWADVTSVLSSGAYEILHHPLCADQLVLSALRLRARFAKSGAQASRKQRALARSAPVGRREVILVGQRVGRLYPLEPLDIDYVEGTGGNYVTFHVGASAYLARDSLKRLTCVLRPFGFVRIEKSLLLNTRAVEYAECAGLGLFAFTLVSGAQLRCGPTYREAILDVLPLRRRAERVSSRTRRRRPSSGIDGADTYAGTAMPSANPGSASGAAACSCSGRMPAQIGR
jgi:DNA-binding LytR/AlgR family response regulator